MHIFAWSPNPYEPKYRGRAMVTPIHRFQRIESMLVDPHRLDRAHRLGRRGRRWGRQSRYPRPPPDHESHRRSRPPAVAEITELPNMEAAPTDTRLPEVPDNFNRFHMSYIKWFLIGMFIFMTLLLLPAHLCLKKYPFHTEILAIILITTLFFIICFSVTMFHTKTRDILMHRFQEEHSLRQCPAGQEPPQTPTTRRLRSHTRDQRLQRYARNFRPSGSTPSLCLNGSLHRMNVGTHRAGSSARVPRSISQASRASHPPSEGARSDVSPLSDPGGEPPPYELALLLPSPPPVDFERNLETPPPAYDIIQ